MAGRPERKQQTARGGVQARASSSYQHQPAGRAREDLSGRASEASGGVSDRAYANDRLRERWQLVDL